MIGVEVYRLIHTTIIIFAAEPPKLTLGPEDASDVIPYKEATTFSVQSTGLEPIQYQWERRALNGEESWQPLCAESESLEGVNSNVLTISMVQESDEGQYRCVLKNPVGSTKSEAATLTFVNAGKILTGVLYHGVRYHGVR